MENEVWKDIPNYEGLYQVSNYGRIKSLNYNKTKKERILIPYSNKKGYKIIVLSKNGKMKHIQIHKIVLNTFKPLLKQKEIKKMPNELNIDITKIQINHIDKNTSNNKLNNLEYCTNAYNINYSQSIKIVQYDLKGKLIKCWQGKKNKKRETKINNIEKCLSGKYKTAGGYIWKYIE